MNQETKKEDFLGDEVKLSPFRKFLRNWSTTLVIVFICIIIMVSSYFLPMVRVSGSSMEPTYYSWDILITKKNNTSNTYDLQIGDVVICNLSAREEDIPDKQKSYIKRVVGRPGDTLVVKDGQLYRNGEKVNESYDAIKDAGVLKEELTLQANTFFVMGDNRNGSYDSRQFGPVFENEITNIVKFKIL